MIGTLSDGKNLKLDEVLSSRSPAEIIQSALVLEFKKAGYSAIPAIKRPASGQWVIDLTKTEIKMDQTSEFTNLKAACKVLMGMDVYKAGQLAKCFQYEATASKTDIRDRDQLAGYVLQDAIQLVMLKAMPELHTLFNN